MPSPLTPQGMAEQLVRLNDTWPRFDTDEDQIVRLAKTYHEALQDLDAEAVAGGIGLWIRTCTTNRWPGPAQVRESAMAWVKVNRASPDLPRPGADGSCPTCKAAPRWAVLQVTDWLTNEPSRIVRQIHPCLSERHPDNSPYVPFPTNFVRWATNTDITEFYGADTEVKADGTAPSLTRLLQRAGGSHRDSA